MGDRTLIRGKIKCISTVDIAVATDNLLEALCSCKQEKIDILEAIVRKEKEKLEDNNNEGRCIRN